MELSKFIKEALLEVVKGVKMAQDELSTDWKEGIINPTTQQKHGSYGDVQFGTTDSSDVELTVAITDVSAKEGETKIGIAPGFLNLGRNSHQGNENTSFSQVRFRVPVIFSVKDFEV